MSWNLRGSYVETCSCELMCPCNLSLDHGATYDFCRVTLVFDIREGEIEGTDPMVGEMLGVERVPIEVVHDGLRHTACASATASTSRSRTSSPSASRPAS